MITSTWGKTVKNYTKKHVFKVFILIISISLVSVISSAVYADIIKKIVSAVINTDSSKLKKVLIWLIGVMTTSIIFKIIIAELTFFFRKNIKIILEDKGLFHVYNTPNLDKVKPNEVMPIMQNTIGKVTDKLVDTSKNFISTTACIITAVIYAVSISWQVVLFCFCVCGIMIFFSINNSKQIPLKAKRVGESFNNLFSIMWDHLHNGEVTPFLNSSKVFLNYDKAIFKNSQFQIQASRAQNVARIFSRFGTVMIVIAVSLYGGFMAINYKMQVSNVLALIVVIPILSDSLLKFPSIIIDFKAVCGEGSVIDKLYELNIQNLKGEENFKTIIKDLKRITVKGVKYRYSKDTPYICNIDSLKIEKGEILCIVGESGVGKSTLINIFSSIINDYEGSIRWDDLDIKKINRKCMWSYMDILQQTPCCLATTIRNNIILNDKEYDKERFEKAIRDSGSYEYIKKLPSGIETIINSKKLSSGEMQKICMARAFYQNKPVLILDEATSAMDPNSENNILEELKKRTRELGLILIAVTHSVNFIKSSDRVLFLQKNAPALLDRHDVLIKNSSEYKEMICGER